MIGLVVRGLSEGAYFGISLGITAAAMVTTVVMERRSIERRETRYDTALDNIETRFDELCTRVEGGGNADLPTLLSPVETVAYT